jgi:type IV secretory pathway VirB10-like protein
MKIAHLLVLGSACLMLSLGAHAQWQWLDKNNKKVFSDQAPPPDIPEKSILRRPGPQSAQPNVSPPPAVNGDAAVPSEPRVAASGAAKPSGVDKELEEKTRKAEEAEKAKKAAEEQKVAQAKAENCSRARQAKATFDSGIRVARVNAQGEREIMDDKARAAEQSRLQSVISADCK